jgi:CubicO group peptidase (beta-lactamase class C family)
MQYDYRDVTIWQLMAHQAGVPAYTMFDEAFGERIKALPGATDAEKRASFVLQILEEPLLFKPGSQAQYSNGGPTIAGRMAEITSGKTWEQLVQEFVFDPAHMTTGGFNLPTTSAKPNGINGYYSEAPGEFVELSLDENILDPDVIAPAGGVHSSIGDLLKYGVTHLEGMRGQDGAVSSATIKALHTPRPGQPKSFGENYTFGWGSRCPFPVTDSLVCQGHNGGGGAYYAQILLLPEENIVIAFMANTTMGAEMVSGPLFKSIADHYRS